MKRTRCSVVFGSYFQTFEFDPLVFSQLMHNWSILAQIVETKLLLDMNEKEGLFWFVEPIGEKSKSHSLSCDLHLCLGWNSLPNPGKTIGSYFGIRICDGKIFEREQPISLEGLAEKIVAVLQKSAQIRRATRC